MNNATLPILIFANQAHPESDKYEGTHSVQILHIDLLYANGNKGVINVTSPHVVWGDDIEEQWIHMKAYIKSQYMRLGIVGYHAHCHYVDQEGTIKKSFSWFPFDLIQNKEIIPDSRQ